VKPALLALLVGVSEQPLSASARQALPAMKARDQMTQSLRDEGLLTLAGGVEYCPRSPRALRCARRSRRARFAAAVRQGVVHRGREAR
jgi:hypothetical protein